MKRSKKYGDVHRRRGFTLIELVVVVLVLGILAAAAAGRWSDVVSDAVVSTLMTNLSVISDGIERESNVTGAIPGSIEPDWFQSRRLPPHPQNRFGIPVVQTYTVDNIAHPSNKVLTGSMLGAYWYNSQAGIIRARVADQGSSAATLDLYNRVNQSAETDLGNYGGGGGGS